VPVRSQLHGFGFHTLGARSANRGNGSGIRRDLAEFKPVCNSPSLRGNEVVTVVAEN